MERLSDRGMLFREVFPRHVTSAGHLPQGSLLMIASLSHLSLSGLAAYTEELTRVIKSVSISAGPGVSVIPGVAILLGGISCPSLIKSLSDLDSWILSSNLAPSLTLHAPRSLVWQRISEDSASGGVSAATGSTAMSLEVPCTFRNPCKTCCVIGETAIKLPCEVKPMSPEFEKRIVSILTAELNKQYCLRLLVNPNLKPSGGLPQSDTRECSLVMVGASHTAKIAALTGLSGPTEYVPLPGQPLS